MSGANLTIDHPQLWSVKHPSLYTLVAELVEGGTGAVVDVLNTSIGLRSIGWSSAGGFALMST